MGAGQTGQQLLPLRQEVQPFVPQEASLQDLWADILRSVRRYPFRCSEYFLPGLWLETGEKQLRMCELCHKKISRYINEHEAKDNGSFVSKESEEKEKEGVVGVRGGSNNRSQHLRDLIAQDEEETLESA